MQKTGKIDIKTPAPDGTAESSSVTANTGKSQAERLKQVTLFFVSFKAMMYEQGRTKTGQPRTEEMQLAKKQGATIIL